MDTSDVTIVDLAKERINILNLQIIPDTANMLASIEYQYKPKDAPHTWHKAVIPIMKDEMVLKTILEKVRGAKAELEQ